MGENPAIGRLADGQSLSHGCPSIDSGEGFRSWTNLTAGDLAAMTSVKPGGLLPGAEELSFLL